MEQGQHTRTEWMVDGCTLYALTESGFNRFTALFQDAHCPREELEANAQLARQAPTLLAQRDKAVELLRSLLEIGSSCTGDTEIVENNRRREAARAFLASLK